MTNWEYKGYYKKYNMAGEIEIGGGILKVHDIFNQTPKFMLQADCVFSDPPCSRGNLTSFYTKADLENKNEYHNFHKSFFQCIDEIKPKKLFLEVFKSNKDAFIAECKKRYDFVKVYDSTYYHNKNNKCWIIHCENCDRVLPINGLDEEKIIEWICQNEEYE